jgi:uncharacterized integral membrane protein
MDSYMLGVAPAMFAIGLIALVHTMHRRRVFGPRGPAEASIEAGLADDETGLDRTGHPTRTLRLVRPTRQRTRSTVATDWLLRVMPGACAAGAVTIVLVTFAAQNTRGVRLDFLDWHLEHVPLAAAVLAGAIVPASIVAALAFMERRRLRLTIRRLEHRLREVDDSSRRPDRPTRPRLTLSKRGIGRHAG